MMPPSPRNSAKIPLVGELSDKQVVGEDSLEIPVV